MLTQLLTYFWLTCLIDIFVLCTGYCIVVHSPVGVFIISFLCFLFLLVCLLFLSVRRFKLPQQQQQHFYRLKRAREREVCVREGDRAKDIGQRRVYYVRWLFLCAFCLFTVPPLFVQRNAQCERPGSVCSCTGHLHSIPR